MEIVVTDITTQVEIEAGQELFEVVVTVADSESAERFAIEARESADEAAISEGIATVKASEALASASNALTSENDAESAATTATEQAVLSSAARDEAVAAKLAAQDSEDNALISALDASLSASNALASENAAELAASQIVDKIDFTGAVEGDLYRVNALGVAEPINETEFLKSKVPFERSVAEPFTSSRIFAWDNVNRDDTAIFSGAGNLDSGQAWLNLAGQNGNVSGKTVRLATTIVQNAVLAFERTDVSGTGSLLCDFTWRGDNNTNMRFFIGKDADNGICFRIGVFTNSVIARVNGIETVVSSSSLPLDISQTNASSRLRISITLVRNQSLNKGYSVIYFKDLNHSLTVSGSTFDSLITSIFSVASDVKYIGLQTSTNIAIGAGISTLRCYNL